jgi:uncharacterized protein (DUF2235 family)
MPPSNPVEAGLELEWSLGRRRQRCRQTRHALEDGLGLERSLGRQLDDPHDYREGFDARLEGREPEFRGE